MPRGDVSCHSTSHDGQETEVDTKIMKNAISGGGGGMYQGDDLTTRCVLEAGRRTAVMARSTSALLTTTVGLNKKKDTLQLKAFFPVPL